MNIKGLDFLLTFKCNASCKHCCYQAGPERHGFISSKQAVEWMRELHKIQPLENITVHGGEPFLYFDEMRTIIEKAGQLRIPERWVITNGYWAQDSDAALDKMQALKDAGVTSITFSLDAFHQEHVPFDTVKAAIKHALKFKLDTVVVDSYLLYDQESECAYNIKTKEYLDQLKKIQNIQFDKFIATFAGRAASLLVEQEYTREKIPSGKCCPPFWLGNSLKDPETIEIDCQWNVTLCPGISIGNAAKQSLSEIVKNYDYKKHPIIEIITAQGPIGLYKLARSYGYQSNKKYFDECHLCYEMRKYLQKKYPQYLTPQTCYDEY